MTKAELIQRYGIEWYEQLKTRNRVRSKERYQNDQEFRESENARSKERYQNDPEYHEFHLEYFREYNKNYSKNDLNSSGKPKHNIRRQSRRILFDIRKHSKIKGYEIHHCFGYDDPSKFIYIPKSLHDKIHRYLRANNIGADSNHYDFIKHMINECDEYTYISV